MAEKCEGMMTALITPTTLDDFRQLVKYQVAYGIHGLLPCGTTGQSPTLSWNEHEALISDAVKIADKKVPVIAGAGSNNPVEGIEATKHAADIGAYATLHVTGYYNCPSQQGFADYFEKVAKAAPGCKVIIYNIPGRGHPIIRHEVVVGLCSEFPNIIGTKDATGGKSNDHPEYKGDGSYWKALRKEAKEKGLDKHRFKIISGDDPATLKMIMDPEIEAVGAISVWSNIFPRAYSDMARLALEGNYDEAGKIDKALADLNKVVGIKDNIGYLVQIGKNQVWVPRDTYRNPESVQRTAYELGMISSPDLRSPMGFLFESDWVEQVGSILYKLYDGKYDIDPDYLFGPIKDFFNPEPSIDKRLWEYRPEK
ncbi:MAG: dihydrodipicolinate synthase family protein [Candidatus Aenigmarchaeota archaeon]|nr:dihydrodipicolinate synthase family protein [Candidatus Aenigmarchaeota archaeon]